MKPRDEPCATLKSNNPNACWFSTFHLNSHTVFRQDRFSVYVSVSLPPPPGHQEPTEQHIPRSAPPATGATDRPTHRSGAPVTGPVFLGP